MSASSPPQFDKISRKYKRSTGRLLSHGHYRLLDLLFGNSPDFFPTNTRLAQQMGVSVRQIQKYLSQLEAMGLVRRSGKPVAFRGHKRALQITDLAREWMVTGTPSQALLEGIQKFRRHEPEDVIRHELQDVIRHELAVTPKGDKYTKKRRKEGESPSLPSSVHGFIEAAKGCGLSYQELTQLACRAVKEGLTLEDWKFCVGKATQQAKGKSGLSLGAAIGQLMRARDFVQANHTASMQALEDHIEKNLEALREAVLRSPAAFRGAERVGNTYVGPFGILDLTSSPVQFLTNINKLI